MIDVKLKCDKSINAKLRSFDVDKRKLELFLNYLVNTYVPTRKWWSHELVVKGIKCESSQYFWGDDEIQVGLQSYDCPTKQDRREWFLTSICHEFRHWVQAVVQKIPEKHIAYTLKDTMNVTPEYLNNPLEVEAREWEEIILKFDSML